ncbi:MAG: hypothetical protein AAGF76_00610 [Pseudomonadota bacterium]
MENQVFSFETSGVSLTLRPTPGGAALQAYIEISNRMSEAIHGAIEWAAKDVTSYDADPVGFEEAASVAVSKSAPGLVSALQLAAEHHPVLIAISGMPVYQAGRTPLDGIVDEAEIMRPVLAFVGAMSAGLGLEGFTYATENGARLLRAVAPVAINGEAASSQGFAADLGWHMDNANRSVPDVEVPHSDGRGEMNPYQGFISITPEDGVPMEVVALDDVIREVRASCGSAIVDQLKRSDFAIDRPDSHGGGRDVEGVPLLLPDSKGLLHGRIHAGNVSGLDHEAHAAFEHFKRVLEATPSVMEIHSKPGDVILYSNTRALHRRRRYTPRLDGTDRYYVRIYFAPAHPGLTRPCGARVLP